MKNKLVYMDIAKGLGIIAVVIGHAGAPSFITNFIYLFHIPLFFFISGYFWKDSYLVDIGSSILNRIRRLYVSYVTWGILFVVLHNIFIKVSVYSTSPLTTPFGVINPQDNYNQKLFITEIYKRLMMNASVDPLFGAAWFLSALLSVFIIFTGISYISKGRSELVRTTITALVFLSGFLLMWNNIFLEYYMTIVFVAVGIFYLGFVYKKFQTSIPLSLIISIVLFTLLLTLQLGFHLVIRLDSSLLFTSPLVLLIASLSGIYITLYTSKLLEKVKYVSRFLTYIGNNTITILMLHLLAFKIVSLVLIETYGYPMAYLASFPVLISNRYMWIIYSAVGVMAPLFVGFLINYTKKRIKYFKIPKIRNSLKSNSII